MYLPGITELPCTISYTFEYYGDWKIAKVSTSCGCTSATTKDNKITLSWNAKTKLINNYMLEKGKRETISHQKATVLLSNPENPGEIETVELSVSANVKLKDDE